MRAIRDHLIAHDTIGLGFCFPHNQGFYEKCGLTVETRSSHRFIYRNGEERLTAEGQLLLVVAGLWSKETGHTGEDFCPSCFNASRALF